MTSDLDFIKPDEKGGVVVVKVNANVFPIDLVYEASYSLMDRAYVVLDGSPSDTIYAILRPRTFKGKLSDLGRIFYDEVISSAFYAVQMVRNRELRNVMLESLVPLTQESAAVPEQSATPAVTVPEDEDFTPEEKEIATLWEEKYGKKKCDESESLKKGGG